MTCYRGAERPGGCQCRRDGLDPKQPNECPYRGLSKRGDDDWSRILDEPPPEPQESPQ